MQNSQHHKPKTYSLFRFSKSEQSKKTAQRTRLKDKINRVVLSYLVQEGFLASALKLSQEAAVPLDIDDLVYKDDKNTQIHGLHRDSGSQDPENLGAVKGYASIERRKQIKYLILKGDISEAIRLVSMYYPTVLDSKNLLLFKLLRLNLIEMIRNHKTNPDNPLDGNGSAFGPEELEKQFLNSILTFVRENLLNKVSHSMDLLRQLETTMSLLCFDFDHRKPFEEMTELPEDLRKLLNLSLRSECYRLVNQTILDVDELEPPDKNYTGYTIEEIDLSRPQVQHQREITDALDTSDLEISPGQDLVKSIESMIYTVPLEVSEPKPIVEETADSETDCSNSLSKLEEIARLWVATELILVFEKLISEKRFLQSSDDGKKRL